MPGRRVARRRADHDSFREGSGMMRRLVAVLFVLLWAGGAVAADQPSNITGLFLTTKYPGLTVKAGETTTVDLALRNFKLPPQSLNVSFPDVAIRMIYMYLGVCKTNTAVQLA